VNVIGLSNVVQISGGWFHAIALKSDGTAWTWGENGTGELGDGTTTRRTTPVQVVGLSNVVSVWGGDNNSMALGPMAQSGNGE
jgi:alpha-tubulin suppressor-like RCC1 family protein